jgi:hypothetical protein
MGMLDLMSASRRRASAVPWRCFHVVRRQLQYPRSTVDPSVPFSPNNVSKAPPRLLTREYVRVSCRQKHVGLAEREILALGYGYFDFQNPPYKASRQVP